MKTAGHVRRCVSEDSDSMTSGNIPSLNGSNRGFILKGDSGSVWTGANCQATLIRDVFMSIVLWTLVHMESI